MTSAAGTSRDRFRSAAGLFVDVVARVPENRWASPGLGAWDVRGLVGHTTRALITVTEYLALDAPAVVSIPAARDYYAVLARTFTSPEAVERRGVAAGESLGTEPLRAVTELLERAVSAVADEPADRTVAVGGEGILLDEYLRTRVFELVVHSMDIARALDVPLDVPPALVEDAVTLAASIAARAGTGERLLMALTGRDPLPPDFSVV